MAQFDPMTIREAHQRAAAFEQQSRSSSWTTNSSKARSQDQTVNTPVSSSTKDTTDVAPTTTKPATQEEQQLRRSTRPTALRCYSCGDPGHRISNCPHASRRGLLIDDAANDRDVYDFQDEVDQDHDDVLPTAGDSGQVLVFHQTCLTPRRHDDKWLRTNIFRSTCTIKGCVSTFVIDSDSSKNVISEDAVDKLGITREVHSAPYT